MNVVLMIRTGLPEAQAAKLAKVRTANEKEVCGTCVMMRKPDMDTMMADIRAIGREVDALARIEQTREIAIVETSGNNTHVFHYTV